MSEQLKYSIGADTSKYERAMDRVKTGAATATKAVGLGFAAAGVAVTAATGALALASKEVLKFGDQIHKANLRLGISTESLSQLRHVADLSGVSFQNLQNGLRYMERQLSEVAFKGSGPAKDALDALGLSIDQLRGLKPEVQFEVISEQLSKVADSTDKAALAAKLYGARGVELVQMAAAGAAGIQAMREEADELGLTLSQDGADAIANFNDTMTRMKARITAAAQAFVVALGPALTETVAWLGQKLPSAVEFAADALKMIPEIISWAMEKLTSFYDLLGKLPGEIGAPYRDAAAALREANEGLKDFIYRTHVAQAQAETFSAKKAVFDFQSLPDAPGPGSAAGKDAAEKAAKKEQEAQSAILQMKQAGLAAGWEAQEQALIAYTEQSNREIEIERQKEETKKEMQKAAGLAMVQNSKMAFAEFGKSSTAAFEAFKAISISETVVNTYASAVAAYKAMAGIPVVGPALGAAAAAAAVAYGLAQVSAISAMSPGSKGSAAGTTSASTTTNANPTGTGSTGLDPAYASQDKKGGLTINVEGDMIGDETWIDRLAEKINWAIEDREVVLNT